VRVGLCSGHSLLQWAHHRHIQHVRSCAFQKGFITRDLVPRRHCGTPLLSAALMRPSARCDEFYSEYMVRMVFGVIQLQLFRVAASLLQGAQRFKAAHDDSSQQPPVPPTRSSSAESAACAALLQWVASGESPPSVQLPLSCSAVSKGILARTLLDYRNIAVKFARSRALLQRWKAAAFATRRCSPRTVVTCIALCITLTSVD
jgi:hypothetical protein